MKKILIVDWLDKYGGAERVLTVLNKQFDFDKCFTLINIMSNSDLNRVFNGKKIFLAIIATLDISEKDKAKLSQLTPLKYIGLADKLAKEI